MTQNKEAALEDFIELLDNPNVPLWRTKEMYRGIMLDKDKLSIQELSKKYGTTEKSVLRIIAKNGYQKKG